MLTPISEVLVLCWDAPKELERRAFRVAEFLGAEPRFACLSAAALGDNATIRKMVPACTCMIADAETLTQAVESTPAGVNALQSLIALAKYVFIYGFQPTARHAALLRDLSSGSLAGVERLSSRQVKFNVSESDCQWCGQLSGVSLGTVDPSRENAFLDAAAGAQYKVLIRAGDKPFFVRASYGRSQVFFLACNDLADLDERAGDESHPLPWFSRLVPLMMFLRGALGNHVWHNDRPRACFIIDDPLLKKRYGFLDYRRLFSVMRQQRFSACVAFIPWNYRRSRREVAEDFVSNSTQASLCVHGCDHTRAEFATISTDVLYQKSQLALKRMQVHERLSGVPFDDVMVFPQGLFSAEALAALKASGYLAAVNSGLRPSNLPQVLRLRDLIDVALMAFADFPLFGRHYPRSPAEFALDLFLGKPALVVEHHGYFRDGYERVRTFARQLNELDQRLEWSNLATICSRACLKRTTADGEVLVRFYTSRFWLENTSTQTQSYLLCRRRTSEGPLPAVTLNGRPCACEQKDGELKIALTLDPGQTAEIRILSEEPVHAYAPSWRPASTRRVRVFVRRGLCEIRDNYIDTNPILRRTVSVAVETLAHIISSRRRNYANQPT